MMNAVTGAMGSLLPMLGELLKEEYNLQTDAKADVQFLERELTSIQVALHKVGSVPRDQLEEQVRLWANDVRDLSYHANDIIDAFLVRVDSLRPPTNPNCFKRLMKRMANFFKKAKARRQIATAIRDIKVRVKEVAERRDRYKLDSIVANPAATASNVDPRVLALYKDKREIVGIEERRDEVIKMLNGGDDDVPKQQLKILSILGVGGLGKTTLAKAVYDTLQAQFDCRAFITVGQNPDVKKVLKSILFEFDKQKYMGLNEATLNERQLIDLVRGLLENKRYFIVIDDMWDITAWEIIRCTLLDSNCGSRIITTTRALEVATKAGGVHKLEPLSRDSSKELFYRRLLSGRGKWPYDQPAEIPEKLLQKCGGIPLAIITIASLLARKPREEWSEVYNSIGFGYGDNMEVENTRKILSFSYYDLPYQIRTCLVHLSIFPDGYMIKKKPLIWMWVAEGFVREESEMGLFEVGEKYFNELINRSMIQPVQKSEFSIIKGCSVHDMVLDMIRSLSKEESFVTILDSNEQHVSSHSNARRLAIQKRDMEQHNPLLTNTHMPQVRSIYAILCTNFSMMAPLLPSFGGLRVLAIEDCHFSLVDSWHFEHLGKLLQLRYLRIGQTDISKLPEVGDLRFLQTLDLKLTAIQELPQSVGLLRQLKCLRIDMEVSDWIGNLTSLEELRLGIGTHNSVKELGKLTELRELKIMARSFDESTKTSLVQSLGNLQKIQILRICGMSFEDADWEGYEPPQQLRDLELSGTISRVSRLPAWINSSLVPNLSRLSLKVDVVKAVDIEILGRFPELLSLELFMPRNVSHDVMGGGAFPKLRYLSVSAPLRFLPGAMPSLEFHEFHLHLWPLKRAKFDFDFGSLGNLPWLQNVRVNIHSDPGEEVEEVEAALRHGVRNHPNRPVLEFPRNTNRSMHSLLSRKTFGDTPSRTTPKTDEGMES